MIRLPDTALPERTVKFLNKAQAALTKKGEYAAQVKAVEELWENRRKTQWFGAVELALQSMCSGPTQRCLYCEDAPIQGIDHFHPKTLYPELAFSWENFVSACQSCNGPKSNHFPLIDCATLAEITSQRPPLPGHPMLINPRTEDPFDYLVLDIRDTFQFWPRPRKETCEWFRADRTIEILALNSRTELIEGRRGAFYHYITYLREYLGEQKNMALSPSAREKMKWVGHLTVWHEMQRQWDKHDQLRELFEQAPEARDKNFLNFTDTMR